MRPTGRPSTLDVAALRPEEFVFAGPPGEARALARDSGAFHFRSAPSGSALDRKWCARARARSPIDRVRPSNANKQSERSRRRSRRRARRPPKAGDRLTGLSRSRSRGQSIWPAFTRIRVALDDESASFRARARGPYSCGTICRLGQDRGLIGGGRPAAGRDGRAVGSRARPVRARPALSLELILARHSRARSFGTTRRRGRAVIRPEGGRRICLKSAPRRAEHSASSPGRRGGGSGGRIGARNSQFNCCWERASGRPMERPNCLAAWRRQESQ